MRSFVNIRMITRIGAWAAASVVALLGLRAVLLSVNLLLMQTRPIVFGDEWVFVSWYFAYLDDTLSLKNFFDLWGDHRVLTTRVVLALDAMYFDLKSQMPIAVLYGSLLLTAALIATCIRARSGSHPGLCSRTWVALVDLPVGESFLCVSGRTCLFAFVRVGDLPSARASLGS